MDYHHHAVLTVSGREYLAKSVIGGRLSLREAAAECRLSRQSAAKWVLRYRLEGRAGLSGTLTVTVPPRPDYSVRRSASRAVWSVAHTNGKAALVPEDIAEVFDRGDYASTMTYKALEDIYSADSESMATEARIGTKLEPGATLRLSPANRDDLAISVAHSMAANANFLYTATSWAAVADAVAHQVQTREAMNVYVTQHRAALAKAREQ